MRLGQLARKLAVRPSEIVEFLASCDIPLVESSNTKLEDDQVTLIMKQFAPAGTELVVAAIVDTGDTDTADAPFQPEAVPDQNELTTTEPGIPEYSPPFSKAEETKVEVIKALKVELSGLKVVGKIDLPELKKKDPPAASMEATEENAKEAETKPTAEERRRSPYKERTNQRAGRKNPIALQREREAQDAERKRHEKAEQEKEQRTKNYFKKVKASAPTKRMKMVEEPTTEMSAAELKEAPRTWVGKFLYWLKT